MKKLLKEKFIEVALAVIAFELLIVIWYLFRFMYGMKMGWTFA